MNTLLQNFSMLTTTQYPVVVVVIIFTSSLQNVLHESQRIRDQFPGDSWIHICNIVLKFWYFLMKGI